MLRDLGADHRGESLGEFAALLLSQIEEDHETLQKLADNLGEGYSRPKESVAWAGSKLARLNLGRSIAGDFGIFQALETLALGILGKLALWRGLAVVSEDDIRLRGIDFQRFGTRRGATRAGGRA